MKAVLKLRNCGLQYRPEGISVEIVGQREGYFTVSANKDPQNYIDAMFFPLALY